MKGCTVVLCVALSSAIFASDREWVKVSDEVAENYSKELGNLYPESASSIGYAEFDSKIMSLDPTIESRELELQKKWLKVLNNKIKNEKDHNVLIDLKILKEKVQLTIDGFKINEQIGDIPYYDGSKWVFNQLQALINPQSPPSRKLSAVDRFKKYVNGEIQIAPIEKENSSKPSLGDPLLVSFEKYIKFKELKYQKKNKFYSLKSEMELYLSESSDYVNGIRELLSQSGRDDWKEDFKKFEEQVKNYDQFIKVDQLVKSRTDYKLPRSIYKFLLVSRGMKIDPLILIKTGRADYKKLYNEFKSVAHEIAKKHEIKDDSPVFVINYLKSKQITSTEEAGKVYTEIDKKISQIIKENKIVTLPIIPLKIRIAGDAESKAAPVPHLIPPPLINNKGERPEFIVPSSSTGTLPFDDFSYKEAAYILVAHEGRPGHDLQFSTMLDNGISIIRSRYAFNNVNVEGWALYSEDLLYPYLPLEAKLPALQMRLWRIARMFLDPEVQLGISNEDEVMKIFTKELGVSPVMANLEFRRYTFQDPGQAPAYYYGLLKIKEAKKIVQNKLNKSFSEICFNDSVLKMGLLPLEIIKDELIQNLKCN